MQRQTEGHEKKSARSFFTLAIFVLVVFVIGGVIGTMTAPGAWYADLVKPPFNPPNWLFAPVWSALYIMIGIAGWLIWSKQPNGLAFKVWGAQQLLNWLWSPVFFTWRQLWPAAFIIMLIFALIVTFIVLARNQDRRAAWLFVPYAMWVGFASLLNISIAYLN